MKTLFGMIITMSFMFAGAAQAGALMSMEDCRDALYEGGGAHTLSDATAVCYERRDEAFVGCVQDRYQDSEQSHTFNSAVSLCQSRVINYVRVCQDHMYRQIGIDWGVAKTLCEGTNTNAITNCLVDAKRLGFNIGRSVQLCQWTTERSVYLCTDRLIRANGYNNEQALMQCYSEFNRDELNSQGVNMRQVEREQRQQQQEAARRAAEQRAQAAQRAAAQREQAAQRAADQRESQRAADQRAEQQRRQDEARREQNNTYRPPVPPPPVRSGVPVVDKGQPVTPARPVVKPAPAAPPIVKQEPVKPVAKPTEPKPAKPAENKPAKPVETKPSQPAKPSAPYQQDESELPPSVRPESSANKPAAPEKPTPVPTADCKATNTCGNDGVIVDLPNL
jgi:hypothetical protein